MHLIFRAPANQNDIKIESKSMTVLSAAKSALFELIIFNVVSSKDDLLKIQ